MLTYNYYSFFTKYSLMENYGFIAGLNSKIFKKIIPDIPEKNTIEFYLKNQLVDVNVALIIKNINKFLSEKTTKKNITKDLDSAITALSSKLVSFGFDYEFQAIFKKLQIDSSCYEELLYQSSALSKEGKIETIAFNKNLDKVYKSIKKIRKNKNVIGTSLHLTVVLSNKLNYLRRIKILLDLRDDIHCLKKWKYLINDYIIYNKSKNSLRKFFTSHVDLLAYEIVEHTAQKGEKYVADNKKEYITFFKKGLLGGLIISIFALFKILIDSNISNAIPLAFLYSINYAICFVVVFLLGGTIATKQPGMTASTIAKQIDKDNNLQFNTLNETILLLRKISRSQFISLMGNFIMAFSVSCIIGLALTFVFDINSISTTKSINLIEQVFPFSGGAIYYAAIAGIFLSLSGFVSGYFDNKVKAINLAYRIQHNRILSRFLSQDKRIKMSLIIEKNLGIYSGNISLGFFLGTAFLASYFLPFNIDIRHIAFSSSNIGYAIITHTFSFSSIILALISVLIIGLINFIVSFSMTFLLVLKSRGIKFKNLGQLIKMSLKDFFTNPLDYIIIRKK